MARILILFSTYHGQTRRIAERIARGLVAAGHYANTSPIDAPDAVSNLNACDAVIVGSAIRFGRHPPDLVRRIRSHHAVFALRPSAFFSVCLSITGPRPRPDLVSDANDKLFRDALWFPRQVASFAGALPYSRYPLLLRLVMRFIVSRAGGDTDTSRDYEYTDWAAVDRFACEFAGRLPRSDRAPLRTAA
jgi:menaquinone-dependent protoporphyrinogen oxidase